MMDYLWPSRNQRVTATSLASEIDALDVQPRNAKGKGKADPTDGSMAPPALVLPEDDEPGSDDEDEAPPMFPAVNSAQRMQITSLNPPPSTLVKPAKPRRKVVLKPGFSQLDWARLKASGSNLKGDVIGFKKITPSELKQHRHQHDAWAAYNGKVYNITPYLDFHPGGAGELMRSAGRDGTKLFMETHAWISIDGMMGECCIGMLVREPE